jgi:hypothetical protein
VFYHFYVPKPATTLSLIPCQRRDQLLEDLLPQLGRTDNFHVRPIFQDIHKEFRRIAVGDAEFIDAVFEELAALFWVPTFIGDPTGTFGGEA